MLDAIFSAIFEIFLEGTGRLALRVFGIKDVRESVAILTGIAVWIVAGLLIFVLVLALR